MCEQWDNLRTQPVVRIPLQFHFEPVEILSK